MEAIFFQLVGDMATSGNVINSKNNDTSFLCGTSDPENAKIFYSYIYSAAKTATLECDKQNTKTLLHLYVRFVNKDENTTKEKYEIMFVSENNVCSCDFALRPDSKSINKNIICMEKSVAAAIQTRIWFLRMVVLEMYMKEFRQIMKKFLLLKRLFVSHKSCKLIFKNIKRFYNILVTIPTKQSQSNLIPYFISGHISYIYSIDIVCV